MTWTLILAWVFVQGGPRDGYQLPTVIPGFHTAQHCEAVRGLLMRDISDRRQPALPIHAVCVAMGTPSRAPDAAP